MRIRHILLGAFILRLLLAVLYPITGDACTHHNTVVLLQQTLGPIDELARGPVWWPYFYHGVLALLLYPFAKLATLLAFGLDLANVLMGVLGVYMVYLITKEMRQKEQVALIAAGIIALFPVHVFYSAVLYTDVPLFAFLCLFIYFTLKERPILASIFGACAIMSKFNGIIVFPFLVIIFLFKKGRWTKQWWKSLCTIGLLTLILGSGFMIRNTIQYGNPISFGQGSGALGRDSAVFENLNLATLQQQYLTFFAVPSGDLKGALSFLPLAENLRLVLMFTWIGLSVLLLTPFFFSGKYLKKYLLLTSLATVTIALHMYGLMRLGPETGFRYSIIFLLPFAFFSALSLSRWKYQYFLLLGLFCTPLFVQAFIANNQVAQSDELYDYIKSLPANTRIFGFQPCVIANTGHTIEMIPYVSKEEYLGHAKFAEFLLLSPGHEAWFEKGDLAQIQEEYGPVVSVNGMTLMKAKT